MTNNAQQKQANQKEKGLQEKTTHDNTNKWGTKTRENDITFRGKSFPSRFKHNRKTQYKQWEDIGNSAKLAYQSFK